MEKIRTFLGPELLVNLEIGLSVILITLGTMPLIRLLFSYNLTYLISRIARSFFYSEFGVDRLNDIKDIIFDTRTRISKLEHLTGRLSNSKEQLLDEEIKNYLSTNLVGFVKERLDKSDTIESSILNNLQKTVNEKVTEFLTSGDLDKLLAASLKSQRYKEKIDRNLKLDRTIDEQMISSGRMKGVMINLFVIFNIGIILMYIFIGEKLNEHALYSITALYISLAAFIVYIYRTSHFRTSVLLSLREDAKKYCDVAEYLNDRSNDKITEHDVELVKLLLINRAEREKVVNHPYEVILKGVTDSNVQIRGKGMNFSRSKGE